MSDFPEHPCWVSFSLYVSVRPRTWPSVLLFVSPLSENQDKQDPHPHGDSAPFLLQTLKIAFFGPSPPTFLFREQSLKSLCGTSLVQYGKLQVIFPLQGVWELNLASTAPHPWTVAFNQRTAHSYSDHLTLLPGPTRKALLLNFLWWVLGKACYYSHSFGVITISFRNISAALASVLSRWSISPRTKGSCVQFPVKGTNLLSPNLFIYERVIIEPISGNSECDIVYSCVWLLQ